MITFENKHYNIEDKTVIEIFQKYGVRSEYPINYQSFISDILDACTISYTQVHDSNIGFNNSVTYNENGTRIIS